MPGSDNRQLVSFDTLSGVRIQRTTEKLIYGRAIAPLIDALDTQRGVLLASSFEYPGRYTRWDIGFRDPPLVLTSRQSAFEVEALNARGRVLLAPIMRVLSALDAIEGLESDDDRIRGRVKKPSPGFSEESRSRQPSIFSVLRALIAGFSTPEDQRLGFYGALGYDLAFQFDPIEQKLPRAPEQRDMVLYLPDEILVVDHRRELATLIGYEFEADGSTTQDMARTGDAVPFQAVSQVPRACDHEPGEYADGVRRAREAFKRGDLFEVVPSQTFYEPCPAPPSEVFRRLRSRNPAPYGAFMNLGQGEYLVAASPEMYVRVDGRRIETCPISGTIARGTDAIGDAQQILTLLSSAKEASELTMCTDVDRNDKSRVCEPGSVRVIGRRQIEMYSRLIHTVDHVEGKLAEGYDALDGFLAHAWAVTVTGAPKRSAMQFIENCEHGPRLWYGGAIGFIGFDGGMNTGLTLRTVRIKDGVAEVRAGATLLYDSDPEAEEAETRLKASALIDAIRRPEDSGQVPEGDGRHHAVSPTSVLMVDHEDSFVHTLGSYLRSAGAEVTTYRAGFPLARIASMAPALVLLSPGPGRPADFEMSRTIDAALAANIPLFGVCLGLQGIVEHFGGTLDILPSPMHGKPSEVLVKGGRLFEGVPERFTAGRYHSLFANRDNMPDELIVSAETADGLVMAVEHRELPIVALQFHPESILTHEGGIGHLLIENVLRKFAGRAPIPAGA